jgi:hypothetical protein
MELVEERAKEKELEGAPWWFVGLYRLVEWLKRFPNNQFQVYKFLIGSSSASLMVDISISAINESELDLATAFLIYSGRIALAITLVIGLFITTILESRDNTMKRFHEIELGKIGELGKFFINVREWAGHQLNTIEKQIDQIDFINAITNAFQVISVEDIDKRLGLLLTAVSESYWISKKDDPDYKPTWQEKLWRKRKIESIPQTPSPKIHDDLLPKELQDEQPTSSQGDPQ